MTTDDLIRCIVGHALNDHDFVDTDLNNKIGEHVLMNLKHAGLLPSSGDLERFRDALERIALLDEADGHELTVRQAFEAIAIATSTLGKHPSEVFFDRRARSVLASLQEVPVARSAFEEALTPSAKTKAAYMGEFTFQFRAGVDDYGDDLIFDNVQVPWTTIKEIMKAIRARALSASPARPGGVGEESPRRPQHDGE